MENYEKVSLITILSAIFFKYIHPPYFIVFFMFAAFLFCVIYREGRNYIFIFFFIPPLVYPFFNYTKPLFLGSEYNFVLRVEDGQGRLAKINSKNTDKLYIVKNKEFEGLEGRYFVKFKVDDIKNFYLIDYLDGEILELKKTFFGKLESRLKNKIRNSDYDYDLEAFAYGVVIGDRKYISEEMNDLFKRTGASHLLAVSGLHFGIVIAVCLFIFSRFSFSYRVKYIYTLLCITFFFMIVAGSPSVWRAYIMGVLFLLSKIFFEKNDNKKSLAISLTAILIMNYSLLFSIAFQMSYLALFAILYLFERSGNDYIDTVSCSFFIQLALSPIFIYYFHTFPLLAFLTNIIVVFIGSISIFMIYINLFLSFFHLDFIIENIVEFVFNLMYVFIKFVDNIPYLIIELGHSVSVLFLLSLFLVLFLYPFINRKYRKFYIPYLLLMFIWYFKEPYAVLENKNYIYFHEEKTLIINQIMTVSERNQLMEKYKVSYIFSPYKIESDKYIFINEGDKVNIGNINIELIKNKIIYERLR